MKLSEMAGHSRSNRICIGRIVGVHGVKGLVRINSYTEEPMDIAAYGSVTNEDGERMFELEVQRMVKTQVLTKIKGVTDRDAAEALRGMNLFITRDVLPPALDNEFYWEDLEGLRAESINGDPLGNVLSVHDFGAGAMLEVGSSVSETILIPFTEDVVPEVDLSNGRVVIDAPAGLLNPVNEQEEKH